jgi:hypothetical protein
MRMRRGNSANSMIRGELGANTVIVFSAIRNQKYEKYVMEGEN